MIFGNLFSASPKDVVTKAMDSDIRKDWKKEASCYCFEDGTPLSPKFQHKYAQMLAMDYIFNSYNAPVSYRITKVDIDGTSAVASLEVTDARGETDTEEIDLIKGTDGKWYIQLSDFEMKKSDGDDPFRYPTETEVQGAWTYSNGETAYFLNFENSVYILMTVKQGNTQNIEGGRFAIKANGELVFTPHNGKESIWLPLAVYWEGNGQSAIRVRPIGTFTRVKP